jgi:membrane-associated phospholipid phosphatase
LNIIGTFVLTALIPIVLIIILWRQGRVSSLHITNPKERTIPYLYSTACFGFWCYFVSHTTHLPKVWLFIALGATVALLAVTIINRWWKISAHLTSMGGLLGGLISMGLYYNIVPTSLVIALLVLSLLLMYARLYLDAHTPMQVVCGYLLGILCTFIPNWIMYHA